MSNEVSTDRIETLLSLIRPAVRREEIYAVKSYSGLQAKLNQNESAADLPAPLKEAVIEKLRTLSWNRYPTDYADPARDALAASLGVGPENVILSNGSNDLIYAVASTVIASGTPVVMPEPIFSLYGKAVRLQDGDLVSVPCDEHLMPDVKGLVKAAVERSSPLLMITNPGSPTGTCLGIDSIKHIAENVPGFVLVDEAYHEFVSGDSALHLLGSYPNLLVMRTFSKAVGLAGLRIGFVVGNEQVIHEIRKIRLPFVLNVLSEATLLAVLENPDYIQERVREVVGERKALFDALAVLPGVDVRPSETNFIIFRTPMPSRLLIDRMAEEGVLIRDVGGYRGLKDFARVTVGTPAENQAFLVALTKVLDEV